MLYFLAKQLLNIEVIGQLDLVPLFSVRIVENIEWARNLKAKKIYKTFSGGNFFEFEKAVILFGVFCSPVWSIQFKKRFMEQL